MTHRIPARYESESRSFLPPIRTLGFNPQLRINDSLLAQSYVEAYDLSYPEALRQIEREVAELKQELSEHGSFCLENLGTLSVNHEGNYEFAPCEAGILSPDLYGLSDFAFKRLKDEETNTEDLKEEETVGQAKEIALQPTLLEFTDGQADEEDSTISIKMSWIRNAVAVAAAVVAFFLIATPVANSNLGSPAISQWHSHIFNKLIPQDTNNIPAEPIANDMTAEPSKEKTLADSIEAVLAEEAAEASTATDATDAKVQEQADASTTQPAAEGKYLIVVASQVKLSNGEAYAAKLQQQGYKDARVYIYNDIVRVVCGAFETEADAYRQLNKMNMKEEFYEAWVYKVKK